MCKIGSLQFVFLKPLIAALTLLLTWAGVYGDQEIKADKAYPYIAFVYNMSYTMALYSLLLFYLGAHDLLKPYKPLLKFVLVKSVIFLTFWQSILCATLVANGTLETGEDGRALQNVLICVEMIVAAPFMLFAFPSSDYAEASMSGIMTNIGHAISLNDVVSDTVHQFQPQYQEYVMHGTEGGATRKIRMKTHIMMGQEMIAARGGGTLNGGAARGGRNGGSSGRGRGGGRGESGGDSGEGGGSAIDGTGGTRGDAGNAGAGGGGTAGVRAAAGGGAGGSNSCDPESGHRAQGQSQDQGKDGAGGGGATVSDALSFGGSSVPPGGKDESDRAKMMANAGFENSYGMRNVEDDLEDDFGEWSDEEEEAESPSGSNGGGGGAVLEGSDAAAAAAVVAGEEGGRAVSELRASAPLDARGRVSGSVGAGTVFDMVTGVLPVHVGEGSARPAANRGSTDAAAEPRVAGAGSPGSSGRISLSKPAPPSRRWASTPAPAPLAPPPLFRTSAGVSADVGAARSGVPLSPSPTPIPVSSLSSAPVPVSVPSGGGAAAYDTVVELGSPEFSSFQEAAPPTVAPLTHAAADADV
jgi:hypothetical protein